MRITNDREAVAWLRDASKDELGSFAESVWSNIFKASGVHYIPLAKIEAGGAPRIEGKGEFTVLPDFDVAGENWTVYIDSKCKRGPVFYRKARQLRHGIDRPNYQAYLRTGEKFGKRAGIAIVECFNECDSDLEYRSTQATWSGRLLVETFKAIGPPFDSENARDRVVYWPRKVFSDIDTLDPMELFNVARGVKVPSYKLEFEQVFARYVQAEMF